MNVKELKLLNAAIEDDRAAMMDLYDLYYPRLTRFLYRLVRDQEVIEELVNDVMLTVWQQARRFRGESSLSTWILGIAYRKGIDEVRKMTRYRKIISQLPDMMNTGSVSNVEELIARHDLDKVMKDLSTEQRAVAVLSFDFGYSYPEISEILGIPVNTVKTRMYYARRCMQSSLHGKAWGDAQQ